MRELPRLIKKGHPLVRFFSSFTYNPENGCHEWGRSLSDGYGRFYVDGVKMLAHIFAYKELVGEYNPSLQVRHKCDNRKCVNPMHLQLGTNQDNIRDKMERKRHHCFSRQTCKNGHPLNNSKVDYRGYLVCVICRRASHKAFRQRKKCTK